jgi:PII-like signaling protein
MNVTVVRIYVAESAHLHQEIFRSLHDEHRVQGATLFKGLAGFGPSGQVHTADLLELSLDLPVVIEFFDTPERAEAVLAALGGRLRDAHVITFAARTWSPPR